MPYHNLQHTESFDWASCPSDEAFWAAVFHDFVYDPMAKDNEEKSYETFIRNYFTGRNQCDYKQVKKLILSTKDHVKFFDPADPDMVWLHRNDLECFILGFRSSQKRWRTIHEVERLIFREYQFVDNLDLYKSKRIELLKYYMDHPLVTKSVVTSIINFLESWEPRYGIFCGSFNPWHRGHQDILEQAERVFDKVIVAQGQNEDKHTNEYSLDDVLALKYHHKEKYEGSLFEYLNWKKKQLGNLTLIRGLRNYHDLHDESSIFNFGQDMTDVPFTYFISKSENLHISSGAIRKLQTLGKDVSAYLP